MTATAVCCLVGPRCQLGGDSFVARKLVPVDGVTGSSRFGSALDSGMGARFAPCGPETQVDGGWLVFVQIRIPKGMEMQIYVPFEQLMQRFWSFGFQNRI